MANLNRQALIREGDMMDKGVLGRCCCLFQLLKKMLNNAEVDKCAIVT